MLTQNLTKQDELPFELAHFQVEELEERLENKWSKDDPTRCPDHIQDGA